MHAQDTSLYGPFYTEPEWAGAFAFNPAWPGFSGGMRYYRCDAGCHNVCVPAAHQSCAVFGSNGAFAVELPAAGCSKGKVKVPCITKADR